MGSINGILSTAFTSGKGLTESRIRGKLTFLTLYNFISVLAELCHKQLTLEEESYIDTLQKQGFFVHGDLNDSSFVLFRKSLLKKVLI